MIYTNILYILQPCWAGRHCPNEPVTVCDRFAEHTIATKILRFGMILWQSCRERSVRCLPSQPLLHSMPLGITSLPDLPAGKDHASATASDEFGIEQGRVINSLVKFLASLEEGSCFRDDNRGLACRLISSLSGFSLVCRKRSETADLDSAVLGKCGLDG